MFTTLLKTFVLITLFDLIYLYFTKSIFGEMIVRIQKVAVQLRYWCMFLVYFMFAVALYWFILKPNRPLWEAFMLGAILYGMFDFISLGIFKKYDLSVAIMDTVWGGVLASIVTTLVRL
jgi:uncharacterized membrane protein